VSGAFYSRSGRLDCFGSRGVVTDDLRNQFRAIWDGNASGNGGAIQTNPGNWLPCDGASLLRSTYPDLFAAIGTTYGATDASHFTIPDLQGRVPLGAGTGSGLSPYSLGDVGGEETHTLVTTETPAHSHTDTGHSHSEIVAAPNITTIGVGAPEPTAIPGVGITGAGSANLTATGGDGAHNNLQPFVALNYYIVALN
jgi:microcystin-dependent protein